LALVTSFRMYNASSAAAAAWRTLFERVFDDLALPIAVIEHGWPRPIDTLWSEPELCCAFMCGWPFVRSRAAMQAIAAPVPSPPQYGSLPRYRSEFLVRSDRGWTTLEETFGHRFGWMAENSQSGFNGPRAHLAGIAGPGRAVLFSEVRGPLGSPSKALEALRANDIDVTALDSFYLDLVRRHDPARLEAIRTVAFTPWTAIPLLVAAPGVDPAVVQRIREHLLRIHDNEAYRPLLDDVVIERFAAVVDADYVAIEQQARAAERAGYAVIR
jgi:ABC-type phosphate/phosphonate transport system substrate-binding protein